VRFSSLLDAIAFLAALVALVSVAVAVLWGEAVTPLPDLDIRTRIRHWFGPTALHALSTLFATEVAWLTLVGAPCLTYAAIQSMINTRRPRSVLPPLSPLSPHQSDDRSS
jgi:hypothetical protein